MLPSFATWILWKSPLIVGSLATFCKPLCLLPIPLATQLGITYIEVLNPGSPAALDLTRFRTITTPLLPGDPLKKSPAVSSRFNLERKYGLESLTFLVLVRMGVDDWRVTWC